jgi:hypothetical protein
MMILSSVVTQIYPFFAVKQIQGNDRKASVTGVTSVTPVSVTLKHEIAIAWDAEINPA